MSSTNFITLVSRKCDQLNRSYNVKGKTDQEIEEFISNLEYDKRKFILVKT